MYFNYALPDWVEPYDYTLVPCECGNLMERGVGLCEQCIDRESRKMGADLKEMFKDRDY